ncbi:MAG: hypothetical protein Q8M35_04915, partial [Pseudohongiella sp.]|nr:hypothetical protein [Pseudohongiella sp.]
KSAASHSTDKKIEIRLIKFDYLNFLSAKLTIEKVCICVKVDFIIKSTRNLKFNLKPEFLKLVT